MPGITWLTEDKQRLAELVREGHGPVAIQQLGLLTANGQAPRSLHAIAQQIRRMRLAEPEVSEKARQARIRGRSVPAEQRLRAEEYLRSHGESVPIHHVVQRYGVTESWTRRILKRMGIARSWQSTAAHPLSRFHDPDYRASVSERVRRQARERGDRQRQASLRLSEVVMGSDPNHPTRQCEQCNKVWPLSAQFFPACQRASTGQTYYLHLCRSCAAERRRTNKRIETQSRHGMHGDEGLRSVRLRRVLTARRAALKESGSAITERSCRACWENWPLISDFWRSSRTSSGTVVFDPRCRLCENSRRREAAENRRARQVHARTFAPAVPN
jgi:hypothetical protein